MARHGRGGVSSIILIGFVQSRQTWIHFVLKFTLKNHPKSRDIINKKILLCLRSSFHAFFVFRHKFPAKNPYSVYIASKMMEIRVGASLVLLNFERISETASKMKNLLFFLLLLSRFSFNHRHENSMNNLKRTRRKKEGSENSTRMNTIRISWIKLFSCALNKLICAFADIHEYMLSCARIETLESMQGLQTLP